MHLKQQNIHLARFHPGSTRFHPGFTQVGTQVMRNSWSRTLYLVSSAANWLRGSPGATQLITKWEPDNSLAESPKSQVVAGCTANTWFHQGCKVVPAQAAGWFKAGAANHQPEAKEFSWMRSTTWLYYNMVVQQYGFTNNNVVVLQYGCTTIWLYFNMVVLQYSCISNMVVM